MDQLTSFILNEYTERLNVYKRLEEAVGDEIERALSSGETSKMHVHSRIKDTDSIKTKLIRKEGKYHSIDEMTDIVGFRIICYFSDQVDIMASIISEIFDIDEANSFDRRALIDPSTFGYVSLHYICSLKKDKGYSDELCDIRFEIQIRTMLQHTWAEIEHDLGYKSVLAVPCEIRRDFARVASLLEVADGYFTNIKNRLKDYEDNVRNSVKNDTADDLTLNRVTLTEFIRSCPKMVSLNNEIAAISNASITEVIPDNYLQLLEFFDIKTIKDLKDFVDAGRDRAVQQAAKVLTDSEIDELISTVGLYYLCRARLIGGDYSKADIRRFYSMVESNKTRIAKKTEIILSQREG